MKQRSVLKKVVGALASVGLVSGLAISSGSAPVNAATGGPIYPTVVIQKPLDTDTGEFTIDNGETLSLEFGAALNSTWAGWADDPYAFTAGDFDVNGDLPAGVNIASQRWYWSASSNSDPSCTKYDSKTTSAGASFSIATLSCKDNVTSVYLNVAYELTNSSGSSKNVDLDADGTTRISADGVEASGDGTTANLTLFYDQVEMGPSGYTMPSTWYGQPSFLFSVCFDDTLAAEGDTVSIHRVFTANGVTVPVYTTGVVPDASFNDYKFTDAVTMQEVDSYVIKPSLDSGFFLPGSSMSISFYLDNSSKSLAGQNVVVSLDVKNSDNESIVKDSCSGGGGYVDSFPTLGTLSGANAQGKGKLSTLKNLPVGTPEATYMGGTTSGYNGDVFHFRTGDGEVAVTRLGPTGSLKINGSAKLTQAITSEERIVSFGWYGTKRDKYVMIVGPMMTTEADGYKLYFGNLNKAGGKSNRTIVANKLHGASGICGMAGQIASPYVVSAPTAAPVVSVRCAPEMFDPDAISYNVFGTLVNDGAGSKITSFGAPKPTTAKPCWYYGVGVNRNATGSKTAVLIYSSIGEKAETEMAPNPECIGTLASNRNLMAISPKGKVTKRKTFTSAALGATEPARLNITPGKTANSWIVFTSDGGVTGPPTLSKAYTIAATLATKVSTKAPRVTATNGFAEASPMIEENMVPISVLKNGSWLAYRIQLEYGMEGPKLRIAIAKFNPKTGAVTSGEALVVEGASYSTKYINGYGLTPKGVLSYYVSPEEGKYQVATWKSYTK